MQPVHVTWLVRRHMPEVLDIERRSFPEPFTEADIVAWLRNRSCIGMVAEVGAGPDPIVAGYMIYDLAKHKIELITIAVHPEWRRCGIGRQLVQKAKDKLSSHRRTRLGAHVPETLLEAQLFFKAVGFGESRVVRGYFEDSEEDAFRMVHRLYIPEPELGVSG